MNQDVLNAENAKKATIDELLGKLSASRTGLSSTQAEERLKQYGSNEIPEEKINP